MLKRRVLSISSIRTCGLLIYGFSPSRGAGRFVSKVLSGSASLLTDSSWPLDLKMAEWPKLGYVTRGFKKLAIVKQRPRLPITPPILRQLKRAWETMEDSFNGRMLWAAACMCFFGFLRTGEVVISSQALYDAEIHLSIDDVKLDNRDKPSYLLVQIKASKTDVFCKGSTVYLGVTRTELCPMAAIVNYMVLSRENSMTSAFFGFSDGQPLTRTRFVKELLTALAKVGIDAA